MGKNARLTAYVDGSTVEWTARVDGIMKRTGRKIGEDELVEILDYRNSMNLVILFLEYSGFFKIYQLN